MRMSQGNLALSINRAVHKFRSARMSSFE